MIGEGFEPGSFVVCVDDRLTEEIGGLNPHGCRLYGDLGGLTKGTVYTVRDVGLSRDSLPVVWLVEIVRTHDDGYEEGLWRGRFRPLLKLSIDAFLKTEQPVGEDA